MTSSPVTVIPLHSFSPMVELSVVWHAMENCSFFALYSACNDKVAYWRRKLFTIPSVKAGVCFLQGLARSDQSYADSPNLESVALYAAMVIMPHLLQQHLPGNLPYALQVSLWFIALWWHLDFTCGRLRGLTRR